MPSDLVWSRMYVFTPHALFLFACSSPLCLYLRPSFQSTGTGLDVESTILLFSLSNDLYYSLPHAALMIPSLCEWTVFLPERWLTWYLQLCSLLYLLFQPSVGGITQMWIQWRCSLLGRALLYKVGKRNHRPWHVRPDVFISYATLQSTQQHGKWQFSKNKQQFLDAKTAGSTSLWTWFTV